MQRDNFRRYSRLVLLIFFLLPILAPATVFAGNPQTMTVAAGASHTVFLRDNGTVWTWGNNSYGQLGDGTTEQQNVPLRVPGLSGVSAVAAGGYHTLALKSDGTLYAWGRNDYGQLGDGTQQERHSPVQVKDTAGSGFLQGIVAVAAGTYHSAALAENGLLYTWGYNASGQLGNGSMQAADTPQQVPGLSGVGAVAAGSYHTLALKSDGTLYAWGRNDYGQLGDGTQQERHSPVQVKDTAGSGFLQGIVTIEGGANHSAASTVSGHVYAWGRNNYGQLGNGLKTDNLLPVAALLQEAIAVAAGEDHTLALQSDGTLYAWGKNLSGQLGNGSVTECSTVGSPVADLQDVAAFAAGANHSAAVDTQGTLYTWGANNAGQLGDGSTTASSTPLEISVNGENDIILLFDPSVLEASKIFTDPFSDEFTISVYIHGLAADQEILGLRHVVTFDVSILEVLHAAIADGSFLDPILYASLTFDNNNGSIELNLGREDKSPPGSGGLLYNITMRARDKGTATLEHSVVDLRDGQNNPLEVAGEEGLVTISSIPGDFNGDALINFDDLMLFGLAWKRSAGEDGWEESLEQLPGSPFYRVDIGPAAGSPPDLVLAPDGTVDFEDLMIFTLMWNWSRGR